MPLEPPQLSTSFTVAQTIRYLTASNVGIINITRAQLVNTLVTASSATVAASQLSAIRVKRVRIWGPTAAVGGSASVVFTWLSAWSPAKVIQDMGIGADRGARIDTKPPPKSLAGEWSMAGTNSTEEVFQLVCPAGTVLEIEYVMRLQNVEYGPALPAAVTVAGATAGYLYVTPLDFTAQGASATLLPVGVPYAVA
jgi:hypothetical protein